ncbi:hypothetical protein Pmar_PMAR010654 [Perkinsus marinus ATCC 50983]|uniref:SAC domain-containing protein n=1 Tax=Perkinsus marinus (strain ATCC 50983 / TXsc) TaxID=423536 RepID=C5L4P4_PERM5|nr:hypothetical protein Pmar_PMAR010654 [Perkinsus marinus ATCC 50983]EER08312.1 hypothetical protein Pmar_PMAR010654 [Perkinsus marinus ATCC 50983]|eukprot:XP_002776496.1 hypothetical protein Pmar_PMAR010654 [Perkinsus marinus ATCC 50983]
MPGKSHPLRPLRAAQGFGDFDKIDVYQSSDLVYVRALRRYEDKEEEKAEYLCIARQAAHVSSRPLVYATDTDIRASSDKRLASDIRAVVGLIQLLQGYYLVVVSEARPVGWIGGRGCHQLAKDERRLIDWIQDMQAGRGYYFCHTYDISRSAQANIAESSLSRFVWNWTHSEGFRRRSRFYAGTRYRKRGINADGDAANEVETEQMLIDLSTGGIGRHPLSSFVQVRGSVPVFWMQDQNQLGLMKPKPPIRFHRTDRNNTASKRHFSGLFGRYGGPILVVNLMRHAERKGEEEEEEEEVEEKKSPFEGRPPRSLSTVENEQEFMLGSRYQRTVTALNADLPPPLKIRYIVFDLKAYSKYLAGQARLKKGVRQDLVDHLGILSEWLALSTGWLCLDTKGEGVRRFQSGVARGSCVDCLDRTNVFQYHLGYAVLCFQLREQGFIGLPEVGEPPPLMMMRELTRMYEEMGDQLAWQYAGSEAHKKYAYIIGLTRSFQRDQQPAAFNGSNQRLIRFPSYQDRPDSDWPGLAARSRDLLISLHRHYANNVSDQEKQHAVNLFLGLYSPVGALPRPWSNADCDVDAFVHHKPLCDDPMDSHTEWWTLPLHTFKRAANIHLVQGPDHNPPWFHYLPDGDLGTRREEAAEATGRTFDHVYDVATLSRFDDLQPPLRSCSFIDVVPRGTVTGVRREDDVRTEKDIFFSDALHTITLTPFQAGVTVNDHRCEEELLQAAVRLDTGNRSAREVEEILLGRVVDEDPLEEGCSDRQAYEEYCDLGKLSRMVNAFLLAPPGEKEALVEHWCMDEDVGRVMVIPRRQGEVEDALLEVTSDMRILRDIIAAETTAPKKPIDS